MTRWIWIGLLLELMKHVHTRNLISFMEQQKTAPKIEWEGEDQNIIKETKAIHAAHS